MAKKEVYTVKNYNTICIEGEPFAVLKPVDRNRQSDVDAMIRIIVVLLNHDLQTAARSNRSIKR